MNALVSYDLLAAWFGSPANGITADGGLYETYLNHTGAESVKGTIVTVSASVDNAVEIASFDTGAPTGVIDENGVADGSPVKVVVCGKARVLLKNGSVSNSGYWCGVSDMPGRMVQSSQLPETYADARSQVGHSLETKTGGTDVLALIQIQFR